MIPAAGKSATHKSVTEDTDRSVRLVPGLLGLFIASGCAALIYEIVWFQLLQLVVGSSAVSLAVLLGTFMGGMCLGSLALPALVSRRFHPLRVYAALELGIGLCGLAVLFGMPIVSDWYTARAGAEGPAGWLARGLVAAACLLLPTLLMGATLPAVARWFASSPRGIASLGLLYGGNIAGAVAGCLLAGFYLLRIHDVEIATWTAVAINGLAALAGLVLAARAPYAPPGERPPAAGVRPQRRDLAVYLTIGLSGFCALGAEVLWTRLLSLLLGGTVYSFSIILAVFLIGLGIGSTFGARLAAGPGARRGLGVCQLLACAAIAWGAWQLAESLPYWPINPSLSRSPWHTFQLDLVRTTWAILPAACLWGASFPLALAALAPAEEEAAASDSGRLVGRVYAANTLGAIGGGVTFSVFLLPGLGTQRGQQLLIGLAALAGSLALVSWAMRSRAAQAPSGRRGWSIAGTVLLAALLAAGLIYSVPGVPGQLIAYGRYLAYQHSASSGAMNEILFQGEGLNSSVAVTRLASGVRSFHVSGKVEASSDAQDMRLQRMLGHLPALFHPQPRSVLVVGCGAGVTAGSFVVHPEVERIVICEIEPLISNVVVRHFEPENYRVIDDPRVEVVNDDARHYILTTRETFDVITSDPIHPWVKGAAALYSQEYLQLCREHLNPGGLLTQWVPLYESDRETVRSELATFFGVFPEGTVWSNDVLGRGYDVVVLGSAEEPMIDVDRLLARYADDEHRFVRESLSQVGFDSPYDLLASFAGDALHLAEWLKDAPQNRDRNLRLQYLAGMGAHLHREELILNEITGYRESPAGLFQASEATRRELFKRLGLEEK